MISIAIPKYLNFLIWLRSGEECAKRLFVAQSTISRRNAETLKTLGINLKKDSLGECVTEGETKFLEIERIIHQLYRLDNHKEKLQLEATFWYVPTLATPAPEGG